MKHHEFDVFLKGLEEVTEEQSNALFMAGCEDGAPGILAGHSHGFASGMKCMASFEAEFFYQPLFHHPVQVC